MEKSFTVCRRLHMKNVTGVRRNGVLYGWRLRPRINHFPVCPPPHPPPPKPPPLPAISVSTLYGVIIIIILLL